MRFSAATGSASGSRISSAMSGSCRLDARDAMPMTPPRIFYGWWIVLACGLVAVIGWSLSVFGMGVYIHTLSDQRGFSISLISTAVTFYYLVNAASLISVGTATAELGPKPVIAVGTVALAFSVAALGFCREG